MNYQFFCKKISSTFPEDNLFLPVTGTIEIKIESEFKAEFFFKVKSTQSDNFTLIKHKVIYLAINNKNLIKFLLIEINFKIMTGTITKSQFDNLELSIKIELFSKSLLEIWLLNEEDFNRMRAILSKIINGN